MTRNEMLTAIRAIPAIDVSDFEATMTALADETHMLTEIEAINAHELSCGAYACLDELDDDMLEARNALSALDDIVNDAAARLGIYIVS